MNIEIRTEGEVTIAVVSGEIDGKTAPDAQAQLLPIVSGSGELLLDMSAVTYLSSAGLRMMLLLYRQAAAQDGQVVLVGLSEEIQETMSMTGFLDYFVLADSVAAGLAALIPKGGGRDGQGAGGSAPGPC